MKILYKESNAVGRNDTTMLSNNSIIRFFVVMVLLLLSCAGLFG